MESNHAATKSMEENVRAAVGSRHFTAPVCERSDLDRRPHDPVVRRGLLLHRGSALVAVGSVVRAFSPGSYHRGGPLRGDSRCGAVISGHGFRQILFVLILYGAIQLLESFYLTPKILGKELKLNPLVVFVSVLLGALIFGPVGALVAAPLVAILLLIYRRLGRFEKDRKDRPGEAD